MSISNILGKDGKIVDGVLPNPYPFPASAGLGEVLAVSGNALNPTSGIPQEMTNISSIGCADIIAPFGTIQSFGSSLIQSAGGLGNLAIDPVNNLTLKGCQTKGSMLVGDGTSSKELIVPVAPALPNGSVLILDDTTALGVRWGGEAGDINSITPGNNIDITGPTANPIVALKAPLTSTLGMGSVALTDKNGASGTAGQFLSAGTGGETLWATPAYPVASVSAGTNISITGPSTAPVVNVQNPLTATLNIGTQNLIAGANPATTFNSTLNNTDIIFQSGGVAGGQILAQFGQGGATLQSGTNQLQFAGTGISNTDQSVGTQLIQTTLTPTSITINNQDNIGGGFIRTTRAANEYAITGDDININGTASASMNIAPGTSSILALGSAAHPSPPFFSPPNAQINLSATSSGGAPNFTIGLQASGQFLTSYSTTIDKDGITQNNSAGSGFTINSNSLNCSIVSGAVAQMTGGTANTATISCSTGAIIAGADTQVFASGLAGAVATPNFTMRNSNTAPTSYPTLKLDKSGVVAPSLGTISAISSWAVDATGTAREWTRIQSNTENTGAGNQDGTLSFWGSINGVVSQVANFNGAQNENNSFRPLDMNGNAIRTTLGDIDINTTASIGTGIIRLTPKANAAVIIPSTAEPTTDFISINPQIGANAQRLLMTATDAGTGFINSIDLRNSQFAPTIELKADFGTPERSITISADGNAGRNSIVGFDLQSNAPLVIDTSGYTNGSLEIKPNDTTGDLILTSANLQSGTSGGSSGQHLRIKLNGTYYKIALLDD